MISKPALNRRPDCSVHWFVQSHDRGMRDFSRNN